MIQKTLLFILTGLILQGCTFSGSGTWKNERIENDKKEQIKYLNDKLIKAILDNDMAALTSMMSDELVEKSPPNLAQMMAHVRKSLKSAGYRILDEYNVHNSKTGINNTIPSGKGDNDYVLNYLALNKEMYVSLLLPDGLENEMLVTVIYGNYDDLWKINILEFGQYSISKKTAPDWYKIAKECYDKSYLVDAVNYIGLSKECYHPANRILAYQKEDDINELYNKAMSEVNSTFTFPVTLDSILTKPQVFRIFPEITEEGIFPMIYYISTVNFKDTMALKAENEKVKKEVGRLFTGIDREKKFVLYRAFDKMPNEKNAFIDYGFKDQRME